MSDILRLVYTTVAYRDTAPTNNPRLKLVDWNRDIPEIPVNNARAESLTIPAGQSLTLFDGTRSIGLDNSTLLSLSVVDGTQDQYHLTYVGGTDPVFRTDRLLSFTSCIVDVAVNTNGTARFSFSSGSLASVAVGDTIFIPGTDQITSQPFHAGNQGFWTVLAKTSNSLTMNRPGDFEAFAESGVHITSDDQIQGYSAAGVQIGDKIQIDGGFVPSNQQTFSVVDVTSKYIQFESSMALAEEDNVAPGIGGLLVFTNSKRYVALEADQECVVRVNGDTSNLHRVTPWVANDCSKPGQYVRTGPTWVLQVVNTSSKAMNLVVISAE